MRTLADFKRKAQPGTVWQCQNNLHPHVSGRRVIIGGKSVLHYAFTRADGKDGRNGRLEFPKVADMRLEGDSVHFLDDRDRSRVLYTWTFVAETEADDTTPTESETAHA